MKRLVAAILALGLVPVLGWAQVTNVVPSKNAVGYVTVKIPPSGDFNMTSMNFRKVGGGSYTMTEIFSTNQLIKSAIAPTFADRLAVWNNMNQTYDFYFQKTDNNFYVIDAFPFTNMVDPEIDAGTVIWVISPFTAFQERDLTFMGEVNAADSIDIQVAANPALTQIAANFATPMVLDGPTWVAAGATSGFIPTLADRIFTWDQDQGAYRAYYLRNNNLWTPINDPFNNTPPPAYIELGAGAWIIRPLVSTNEYTVTINRPYTYPVD